MRRAYWIGESVTLTATFTNEEGGLADPSVVTLKIKTPDGQIASVSPTRKSLGLFSYVYSLAGAKPGQYVYRFQGTGLVQTATEETFAVIESAFP